MNEHVRKLLRIISAGILLALGHYVHQGSLALYLGAYFIAGYDVLLEAFDGIREHEIFDECFLMAIATIGAMFLGEYSEACAVMIFYQLGELFQDYASGKSRRTITALLDIRPDYAYLEREGALQRVSPSSVAKGSVILVKPGEKIPIDGTVIEGHSAIDTRALTGESIPRDIAEGYEVLSGCVNISGVLRIKTTKEFQDSTVSKILELTENASNRKARAENFITRFARIYTTSVCTGALLLAVIPSVLNPSETTLWLYRALTFLVISCPCALVMSIPLTFFAAIGGAGRAGILVKGSSFIEVMARAKSIVFDKTGTLTRGVFDVVAVHPEILSETELLHLAAHVERYSTHPVADSLRRAYPNESDSCTVSEAEELAGYGVRACVNGATVCVGNSRFMDKEGISWHPCTKSSGMTVHVAVDGNYAGHIVISDVIKDSASSAVSALKAEGISHVIMFTGDTKTSAEVAAEAIGISEVYSELLPADKVTHLAGTKGPVVFVGDGINDAPVLAIADAGIAMGALGSDAAVEAADVVLMNDDPLKVAEAVRISRRCMSIVKQNIVFTVGVKFLCLVLGAVGLAGMRAAVFADVGVMVLVVMNAMRAMLKS